MNLFVTSAQLEQAKVKGACRIDFYPRGVYFYCQGVHLSPCGCLLFIFPPQTQLTLTTQDTVVKYRKGELNHLSEDEIWSAKHLYDSAYHPDTGGWGVFLKQYLASLTT